MRSRSAVLAVAFCCALSGTVHAWQSKPEGKTLDLTVTGEVTAVSKQGIAVEHARTESASSEMYLPFDPQVKFQGVQAAQEIHTGDTVLVEYREVLAKDEQGTYAQSSRVALRVALVSRAPEQPPGQELPEDVEDATDAR